MAQAKPSAAEAWNSAPAPAISSPAPAAPSATPASRRGPSGSPSTGAESSTISSGQV